MNRNIGNTMSAIFKHQVISKLYLYYSRNLPERKKFIADLIKEIIIYRDYVEVIFRVVFSFNKYNKVTYNKEINFIK